MTFFSTSKYRGQMVSARQWVRTSGGATGDNLAFYLWEYDDLAYTYSWQSHPIWITRDHYIETRSAVLALQGHGTVTLTLSNELGDTDAHTITIDSDVILNYRLNTSMTGEYLTIRLEASGDDGGGAGTYQAPLIHRLFLGYHDDSHLVVTDV